MIVTQHNNKFVLVLDLLDNKVLNLWAPLYSTDHELLLRRIGSCNSTMRVNIDEIAFIANFLRSRASTSKLMQAHANTMSMQLESTHTLHYISSEDRTDYEFNQILKDFLESKQIIQNAR